MSKYEPTQEVRIASVMFGGVSLAVYMNGITQELLRAVRATAPKVPQDDGSGKDNPADPNTWTERMWELRRDVDPLLIHDELQGTEGIYRELGQLLFHGRVAGTSASTSPFDSIRTRIVVDLLAGTSAGGINSVYLAKALAQNQSLDQLKNMWMTEADLDTLLNDGKSDPSTYPPGADTTSLLNSTRMYGLLLEAFSQMDLKQKPGTPLADEIDLFVTTTDLNGVATPIQLSDRVIEERVNKASFHFAYGPGRLGSPNDFTKRYNPMLAFASRCTSSFPIAFEPMTLEHADRSIAGLSLAVKDDQHHIYQKFFAQFRRGGSSLDFTKRPLADGGYLNNKPFSFVIDQIKLRTGTVPVKRKLLFLDPFPELNRQVSQNKQNIDVVTNALDAATTLPRYQTIREDIQRLNEYNRGIHAAQSLAKEIEAESPDLARDYANDSVTEYPERSLNDLADKFGICYRTYHRLRVSAVTTELATLVTRLMNLNDRSDYVVAVRMLIHAWRREHYAPNHEDNKELETLFLCRYDIGFRIRRANYVRGRIDALLSALASPAKDSESGGQERDPLTDLLGAALDGEMKDEFTLRLRERKEEARGELYRLRDLIEFVKWKLSYDGERLRNAAAPRDRFADDVLPRTAELFQILQKTVTQDDLDWIMRPVDDDQCQLRACELYRTGVRNDYDQAPRPISTGIRAAANQLAESYKAILGDLSVRFVQGLDREALVKPLVSVVDIIREYVWIHYQYFDLRDMQVFTVMQDQLAGEGSAVEIYRVSPLDAVLLRTSADPSGSEKLAGTSLFDFGAFLSEEWRANDMMWGRLDGAERIIGALLPDELDEPVRSRLCDRAFHIIIHEEFTPNKCRDLIRPLMQYLKGRIGTEGKSADQFLKEAMLDSSFHCPAVVRHLLQSISNKDDQRKIFEQYYVKPSDPPVEIYLNRLRRAIRIFGNMLQALDKDGGKFKRIAGIAAALTRFAEFCVPQSMGSVFLHYALQLLYAIALVLIVAGASFYKEAESAGWIVLGIAVAGNLATWIVRKWLFRERAGGKIVGVLAAIVVSLIILAAFLLRFECELPKGAWKAPLHHASHLLDSRCVQPSTQDGLGGQSK